MTDLYKDTLLAITPQAKIEYKVFILNADVKDIIKYELPEHFADLCKEGCVNYGIKWSCPPYAPVYHEFVKNYNNITICFSQTQMDQFGYIKNDYLKIKAANTILKSRIDKALRKLIDEDTFYISTGSCRLCKSCKCKIHEPCSNPDIMTYSFEALGINVADMVGDLFGIPLLWYRKNQLPQYTSVVAGLISKEKYDQNLIIEVLETLNENKNFK